MSIDIGYDFYFEFSKPQQEKIPDFLFLGQEFLSGHFKLKTLEKAFPQNQIVFFPVHESTFEQTLLIQNLKKQDYFSQFDMCALDWPQCFSSVLSQIQNSQHSPLLLCDKETMEQGVSQSVVNSGQTIYFLESCDARRLICQQYNTDKIFCFGKEEQDLKYCLPQEDSSPLILQEQGLFPYLTAKLLSQQAEQEEKPYFEKLWAFLNKNQNKKILIVAQLSTCKSLSWSAQKKIASPEYTNNVIPFATKPKQVPLFLCRPTHASALDFSLLNGFLSKKILQINQLETKKTALEILKENYSQLFWETAEKYEEWTKMEVTNTQSRDLFRFAYRLAHLSQHAFPRSFDLLLSARSIINSNFAHELHKLLSVFPNTPQFDATLPEVALPLEYFYEKTEKISLEKFATLQSQRKNFNKKNKLTSLPKNKSQRKVEPVSEEKYADNQWIYEDSQTICSFPNEDIFMEKLALDIKKKRMELVRQKEEVVSELTTDFGEGLNIRETIRNWHKNEIMVNVARHTGKADIGAVVFSFAAPEEDERFSWKSLWLAEQHDDSHLMFYATPYQENLIGPGVAKSEFGGFAVLPLDNSMELPWEHPFLQYYAKNNCEAMLLAGALTSPHKSILLISQHPPSQHILKILKQSGKSLLYARLDEFSQDDIRQVRTFHILAEAGVRAYAEKYIQKESR